MYVNEYDKRDAGVRGDTAEQIFERLAKSRKFKVKRSTTYQNMNDHIDYFITKKHKISVDVKGLKRDDMVYVEFKNVAGKTGWIYGLSDCIAFMFSTEIIIVYRKKLLEFVESVMDVTVRPYRMPPEEGVYYKMYGRTGRRDRYTVIKKEDLLNMTHLIWELNE